MARKIYVSVLAEFNTEGKITPRAVLWHDGRIFEIDRVFSKNSHAAFQSGGYGTRYRIRISGKVTFLNLQEGRWFVEIGT